MKDLHSYKDYKVCYRNNGDKFQIGIYKNQSNGIILWLSNLYHNSKIATTSGVEYACVCIDKLLLKK